MASASTLSPTFYGHIASTQDALLLFEVCISGALNHVARRPHDRERATLIKSGNIFIYEEHSSGIKRWTDGVPWSPSRILGNFLVYRELERPFPPGEKRRSMKRSKRCPGISEQEQFGPSNSGMSSRSSAAAAAASNFDLPGSEPLSKETERSLIGSLVDSYGFKEDGLVKKTISVTVGGITHHLVSYYTVTDVMNNKFSTPSKDPRFQHITPRPDLITKQKFCPPIDEVVSLDRMDDQSVYATPPYAHNGYEMAEPSITQRPISLPSPRMYAPTSSAYNNYGISLSSGPYLGLSIGHSGNAFSGHFAPNLSTCPPALAEIHELGGHRQKQQQRYNSIICTSSNATRA
jgi:Gti1/Pac2 family transcription factor